MIISLFILVGVLDQWVKKESLIRYMGEKSGIYGVFFTLLLATVAVGPYSTFIPHNLLYTFKRKQYVLQYTDSYNMVF